jgi:hypothetical protein
MGKAEKKEKFAPKRFKRWKVGEYDAWDIMIVSSSKLKALATLFYAADNCGNGDFGAHVFGVSHVLEEIAEALDTAADKIDGKNSYVRTEDDN